MLKSKYNGEIFDALFDISTHITLLKNNLIHDFNTYKSRLIKLQPVFENNIKAYLIEVQADLVFFTNIRPAVKTALATCKKLNLDILLDCETHEALFKQVKLYNPNFIMIIAK